MKRVALPALPLLALLLGGCDELGPFGCTETGPYLVVEVRDANNAAAARGARGVIRDGSYTDELREANALELVTQRTPRAGTYDVTVGRGGFTATRSGIRVREGACGVFPERISVILAGAHGAQQPGAADDDARSEP